MPQALLSAALTIHRGDTMTGNRVTGGQMTGGQMTAARNRARTSASAGREKKSKDAKQIHHAQGDIRLPGFFLKDQRC
jgi:hypothetical protein